MQTCTIDLETYYDPVYSLSKLTVEEYVRAPLFETIGFAAKFGNHPTDWVRGKTTALQELELEKIAAAGGQTLVINETNLDMVAEVLLCLQNKPNT